MKSIYKLILPTSAIALSLIIGLYAARESLKRSIFSFLSLNQPINAEVLVIEGWLTDRMLKEAAEEYLRERYSYCLVIGIRPFSRSPTGVLSAFGIDSASVKFTDSETRKRHKTYHRALAARQWLQLNDPKVSRINVFTAGPHGRKSRVIFRRVFGQDYTVGILTSSICRHDTGLRWESKQGTRNMIKYGLGYVYALLWPFEN